MPCTLNCNNSNDFFQIPEGCTDLHHEVELGVVISEKCTAIPESNAMHHVAGYALALDMTARDFQVGLGLGKWFALLVCYVFTSGAHLLTLCFCHFIQML